MTNLHLIVFVNTTNLFSILNIYICIFTLFIYHVFT